MLTMSFESAIRNAATFAVIGLCAFGSAGFIAPATAVADVPPPWGPAPTGGNPQFAGWAQSCHDGSMRDCDSLFHNTNPVRNSDDLTLQYNVYGQSCGNRSPGTDLWGRMRITCAEQFR